MGRLKTLPPSPQVFYPSSNYGSTWNSGYWGGNYWGSGYWGSGYWGSGIYFGAGYFCDPFYMWTWGCYNPYAMFTAGYPYYFDPAFAYLFPSPFFSFSLFSGPYPYLGSYPFGYPSYSSLLYGTPFSSTVFGSFCPLCTTSNSNFSLFTLDNPYLLTTSQLPTGSSASLTNGGTLSSADAASASSTAGTSSGSALFAPAPTGSGQPATVSGTKLPAATQPVSLVFTDGSTVQATQYWLADGKLHYVTVAGQSQAIPLGQFDIQATMKANQRNGVRFLPPAPRQQKTEPKHS